MAASRGTVQVHLRSTGPTGAVQHIHFPFLLGSDTPRQVASEMVADLGLGAADVDRIADVIRREVLSQAPHWKEPTAPQPCCLPGTPLARPATHPFTPPSSESGTPDGRLEPLSATLSEERGEEGEGEECAGWVLRQSRSSTCSAASGASVLSGASGVSGLSGASAGSTWTGSVASCLSPHVTPVSSSGPSLTPTSPRPTPAPSCAGPVSSSPESPHSLSSSTAPSCPLSPYSAPCSSTPCSVSTCSDSSQWNGSLQSPTSSSAHPLLHSPDPNSAPSLKTPNSPSAYPSLVEAPRSPRTYPSLVEAPHSPRTPPNLRSPTNPDSSKAMARTPDKAKPKVQRHPVSPTTSKTSDNYKLTIDSPHTPIAGSTASGTPLVNQEEPEAQGLRGTSTSGSALGRSLPLSALGTPSAHTSSPKGGSPAGSPKLAASAPAVARRATTCCQRGGGLATSSASHGFASSKGRDRRRSDQAKCVSGSGGECRGAPLAPLALRPPPGCTGGSAVRRGRFWESPPELDDADASADISAGVSAPGVGQSIGAAGTPSPASAATGRPIQSLRERALSEGAEAGAAKGAVLLPSSKPVLSSKERHSKGGAVEEGEARRGHVVERTHTASSTKHAAHADSAPAAKRASAGALSFEGGRGIEKGRDGEREREGGGEREMEREGEGEEIGGEDEEVVLQQMLSEMRSLDSKYQQRLRDLWCVRRMRGGEGLPRQQGLGQHSIPPARELRQSQGMVPSSWGKPSGRPAPPHFALDPRIPRDPRFLRDPRFSRDRHWGPSAHQVFARGDGDWAHRGSAGGEGDWAAHHPEAQWGSPAGAPRQNPMRPFLSCHDLQGAPAGYHSPDATSPSRVPPLPSPNPMAQYQQCASLLLEPREPAEGYQPEPGYLGLACGAPPHCHSPPPLPLRRGQGLASGRARPGAELGVRVGAGCGDNDHREGSPSCCCSPWRTPSAHPWCTGVDLAPCDEEGTRDGGDGGGREERQHYRGGSGAAGAPPLCRESSGAWGPGAPWVYRGSRSAGPLLGVRSEHDMWGRDGAPEAFPRYASDPVDLDLRLGGCCSPWSAAPGRTAPGAPARSPGDGARSGRGGFDSCGSHGSPEACRKLPLSGWDAPWVPVRVPGSASLRPRGSQGPPASWDADAAPAWRRGASLGSHALRAIREERSSLWGGPLSLGEEESFISPLRGERGHTSPFRGQRREAEECRPGRGPGEGYASGAPWASVGDWRGQGKGKEGRQGRPAVAWPGGPVIAEANQGWARGATMGSHALRCIREEGALLPERAGGTIAAFPLPARDVRCTASAPLEQGRDPRDAGFRDTRAQSSR